MIIKGGIRMTLGLKFLSRSYILLSNGDKMYLKNSFANLEKQMNSKEKTIEVTTSNLFSRNSYFIKKEQLESYGKLI